eukprot:5459987-Pyramimonas_sp.AAC.1
MSPPRGQVGGSPGQRMRGKEWGEGGVRRRPSPRGPHRPRFPRPPRPGPRRHRRSPRRVISCLTLPPPPPPSCPGTDGGAAQFEASEAETGAQDKATAKSERGQPLAQKSEPRRTHPYSNPPPPD